ncbi:hypothetical protein OC835_007857 [Tilletia horrida]|nr:hypothetical protein OC835_007857 [Tilletia horrida]KAK0541713.1 hypothetical protein OC844_007990 [Tilletia horrida]
MTAVLGQYSHSLFNRLLSVEEAENRFRIAGGISSICDQLEAAASKHPSAAHFGIQLLHRHSDLDEDEIMLGFGRTVLPVKHADIDPAQHSKIHASIWGIDATTGDFLPLEFAMADKGSGSDIATKADKALFDDIAQVLKSHDLQDLLGLALLNSSNEEEVGLESTQGRANIIIPLNLMSSPPNAIPVVWELVAAFGTKKKCKQVCEVTDKHRGIHIQSYLGPKPRPKPRARN